MEVLLLLLRLVLAAIFGLAGVAKFLDLDGSVKAFKGFGIPAVLARHSSIALSVFEIVLAVMFLSIETAWLGAVGAAALLLLFIGQMIYQMAKGNAPDCHCFGQLHSAPVGKISIGRNVGFAVLALFLVSRGVNGQGMSLADPRLDVMQLAFGIVFITFLAAVLFYLKKISEQQVQIMRRIELMDLVAGDSGEVERETSLPHEGLPIGAVFPDFDLSDTDGIAVSLADLKKKAEPMLFFFVSPACNPCKALVPEFERWQRDLTGKVQFVFVSNGKPEENLEKFGGDADKTILLQKQRELADSVKAKWTPTAVLIGADGRVASHTVAGDSAIRDLVERIKAGDLTKEFTHFSNGNGNSRNKIGESVPDFALTDMGGEEITPGYFKDKQTLVAFWSLTCPHCVSMMDELRAWDKIKGTDEPNLIVVSEGDPFEHSDLDLKSPVILDDGRKVSVGFGMVGTPSAVLVNEDGKIISETAIGAADIWSLVGKTN